DCLHLAADTGYTYLIEAERPGCFLEPGDLRADAVLRPSCLENFLAAHSNERSGLPSPVALACHNSPVNYPLFEGIDHEGSGNAAVLCFLEHLLVRAPCRDASYVFAEIWIF